jgi:uncharacterized membrane protein
MKKALLLSMSMLAFEGTFASATDSTPVPVTVDNFVRAETDLYFSAVVKKNGFGKFEHNREQTPIDQQTVIRMNRDTLYSAAVFDLAAGPVTITLPDPGKRFMSMQVISEDQYTPEVIYTAGPHVLSQDAIGTRYVFTALRILVNSTDPKEMAQIHALQDSVRVSQPGGPGTFEVPAWDQASQKKVRDALLVLASTLPDTNHAFGRKGEVDPNRWLIGAASAWGGNPDTDAVYLNVTPAKNDGETVYTLVVKDVPVDGFWSISLYNAKGYFEKNSLNMYSLNNYSAQRGSDGATHIQFGGCRPGFRIAFRSCRAGTTWCGCIGRASKFSTACGNFPIPCRSADAFTRGIAGQPIAVPPQRCVQYAIRSANPRKTRRTASPDARSGFPESRRPARARDRMRRDSPPCRSSAGSRSRGGPECQG